MNPQTKKILLIIGIVAVVAAAAVVYWLMTRTQEEPLTNTITTNENVNTVIINTTTNTASVNTNTAVIDETVAAQRLANLFTERFGSYSSEAEYQNITDLKKFMTAKMQTWADGYIADQKKLSTNATAFQSATAKVVTTSIINQSDSGITFRITTVRTSGDGSVNGQRTYNQDILIRTVQDGTDWKVDSAYWQ